MQRQAVHMELPEAGVRQPYGALRPRQAGPEVRHVLLPSRKHGGAPISSVETMNRFQKDDGVVDLTTVDVDHI